MDSSIKIRALKRGLGQLPRFERWPGCIFARGPPCDTIGLMTASYAIAIGSNRRGHHGSPMCEVAAAIAALGTLRAVSPTIATPPIGPSIRRFANAAVLIDSDEAPPELLARLKRIERRFGRRRGQRWGTRVIDLDIILWSGGSWASPGLIVPHPAFRQRRFVLAPLARIAPLWRDPVTGLNIRHLAYRARSG